MFEQCESVAGSTFQSRIRRFHQDRKMDSSSGKARLFLKEGPAERLSDSPNAGLKAPTSMASKGPSSAEQKFLDERGSRAEAD